MTKNTPSGAKKHRESTEPNLQTFPGVSCGAISLTTLQHHSEISGTERHTNAQVNRQQHPQTEVLVDCIRREAAHSLYGKRHVRKPMNRYHFDITAQLLLLFLKELAFS